LRETLVFPKIWIIGRKERMCSSSSVVFRTVSVAEVGLLTALEDILLKVLTSM
jgi:hypothetical protein